MTRGYDINPFAMADTAAEIHRDWPMSRYLEDPALSRSTLWPYFTSSPIEAHYKEQNESESDPMRLGTAAHSASLEPELFGKENVCWPSVRNGKKWEAFKEEHAGKNILKPDQWDKALEAGQAVGRIKGIRRLIAQGSVEAVITWTDPMTGRRCKVRLDWLALDEKGKRAVAFDLKMTSKPIANGWALGRAASDYGYHMQAGMAKEALDALGYRLVDYWHIWVSSKGAPIARKTYLLPETIEEGQAAFRQALDTYHACDEAGEWPGPTWPKDDPLPWTTELQ